MKKYTIIVAGGSGNRMNTNVPKQFMLLAGKPVLMHTIQRFFDADPSSEIIVVLPQSEINRWKELCTQYSFTVSHHITEGGENRFHSVKIGLALVNENSVVAIHDGVRPFVTADLINRAFSEAEEHGNAVPAIPVNESIRKVEGYTNEIMDRDSFVIIQTPQCFTSEILKKAYSSGYKNIYTDDASVVESCGEKIHLLEGERENIKITYPVDLLFGESILKKNLL